MDFTVPAEVQDAVAKTRAFVEQELYPLEDAMREGKGWKALLPTLNEKRDRVRAMGLFAPHIPKALGGAGLSLTTHARISEELGKSPFGHYTFNCQAPDAGNMELLMQFGSDAQKKQWLEPLARGEIRSCFSMTEPDLPGSNPTWLATRADRDGDHWVINGRKWFTSSADGAAFAIVMAVTSADGPPHSRASMILVPTDTKGFELVRNISIMGDPGEDYASHAEVAYTDCRVPLENLIGPENAGFLLAQERLGPGRIHHAMRWIGICERAFELMVKRAATRDVAPGRKLGQQQMVQLWIAEARARIDAARLYVIHTAWRIEHEGASHARDAISAIKFFVADVLTFVLDRAIQVHGALGMTDDTVLSYFYRHERGAHIYDGADEVHKASLAKRILSAHGFKP
ncbi:MAG: acyl-CoA dehydrogenase family protein [Polyangiaceae bacterium]